MPGGPEALDAAVRFAWRLCVPADEASPTGKMTWDNFLTMARKVFLVTKLRSHNAVVDPIECLYSVKRDWEHCAAFKPHLVYTDFERFWMSKPPAAETDEAGWIIGMVHRIVEP